MKTFVASVQVAGFVEVEVEAHDAAEAQRTIEKMRLDGHKVESLIFQGFETEPTEKEEE